MRHRIVLLIAMAALVVSALPAVAVESTDGTNSTTDEEPYEEVELQARTNLLANDEGFNLPPGSSFNSTTPDINNNAEVAFRVQQVADPSPTDMQGGVWLGGRGEGEIVHLTGDLDPGDVGMNNDGDFAFNATVDLGTSYLYLYDAETQDAERIVPDPILANSFSGPRVNDAGEIGFQATLAPGRIFGASIDGEGVTYVRDSGVDPDSPYTFLHGTDFNNIGQIAAKVATSSDQFTEHEIRVFEEDGSSELIVANDATDPSSEYSEFDNSVAVNDEGTVAAIARRASDNNRVVIRIDGETVTEIAEISDDGPIFDLHFFPPAINNEGQVAFRADDENGQAIYVGDGDELTRVVGDGDEVDTDLGEGRLGQHDDSPVFGGAPSINDAGDIVFTSGLHPEDDDQIEWGTGVMVAYSGVEQDPEPELESVEVEPKLAELAPGETQQFTATAHYDDESEVDVTDDAAWSSDDTDVVVFGEDDSAGLATAVAEGEADVTAELWGLSDSASVTVSEDPRAELESVEVDPQSAELAPGETQQFTATAHYDDESEVDVTDDAAWSSDDTDVVTVDDVGLATAEAVGEADVTAEFGGLSDFAEVTVSEDDVPPPEDPVDLVVSPDEATIGVDGTVQLSAEAIYEDDEPVDVTGQADWTSGDDDVSTVDDAGEVTGHSEGAVEVTATFEGQSDSATVTVDAEVEPGPVGLERISAEPGRVEVAIAASEHRFDDGETNAVVLARADEYPDALAGTTLAAEVDAPLLLTSSDDLLDNVAGEIARVLGEDGLVFLTGGTAALDDGVENAIDELGYQTMRLGGETRFETAGLIAEELGERSQVLVTTGLDFPDALTAGAAAAAHDGVVLLSAGEDAHDVVDEYLDGFDGEVTAVGGPATRAYPEADAVMGATRDETAVAVAEAFFDEPAAFGVARRDDYPDALSGGAHIAAFEGPLLLTYTEDVPEETADWLTETQAAGGFVYGGTAAVSEDAFDELEELAFGDDDNDEGQ